MLTCRPPGGELLRHDRLDFSRHIDIGYDLLLRMRILLDEMCDGWHDRLQLLKYDVSSVVRLRKQDCDLSDDSAVIAYARDNHMVLITKDVKCEGNCKAVDIKCILLGDEELFQLLLEKLKD